jgi:hypothetical protein
MSDEKKQWPAPPALDAAPAQIEEYLQAIWPRLHPSSDAALSERAYLDGCLLGVCMRLLSHVRQSNLNARERKQEIDTLKAQVAALGGTT